MAPKMKKNTAHRRNYGEPRRTSDIRYIALHYTSNDGDSDEGNANYFHNNVVNASAHYFVDDDSITQSVPDDYTAWSVGGSLYLDHKKTGGGRLYGIATNRNTLNIEMCDTLKDGVIRAQEPTINNAIWLIRKKMKQYDIDIDHVIRHFDVNGKHCPAYLVDEREWKKFKARILSYEIGRTYKTTRACYLRMSDGTGDNRALYSEVTGSIRNKCKKSGAFIKMCAGKTFTLADIKVVGSNIWGKTKSGYWVPLKYKGMKRAK